MEICIVIRILFFSCLFSFSCLASTDQFTQLADEQTVTNHLDSINLNSSYVFSNNDIVMEKINYYLRNNRKLLSKMLSLSQYYFPIFETYLDKYNLPFELKYLAIVESSLNTRAKSQSGARGLWQFMYPTGKAYDLNVTSYVDERLDPYKSTDAACRYFLKLYDIFGDWNLVLAAYNGGPGYVQRLMLKTGHDNYWDLRSELRTETRNYVPKFIATTYLMTYHNFYNLYADSNQIIVSDSDTITLDFQLDTKTLSELSCLTTQIIQNYNPSFKDNLFPASSVISLPKASIDDFYFNYEFYRDFASKVKSKEILIDETRVVYSVKAGDYLGRIAKEHKIKIFQIQKWNNLNTTKLNIGDKLILYVANDVVNDINNIESSNISYEVQKGDTLWDIAKMYSGVSVSKIKKLNNLKTNNLKPGSKLLIPKV